MCKFLSKSFHNECAREFSKYPTESDVEELMYF